LRLLFLQAHRETDRFFATSGVHLPYSTSGLFHFCLSTFSAQVKGSIVNILPKAATLRITMNIDGTPIVSLSHTHPSHSKTPRLLTSSLSLGHNNISKLFEKSLPQVKPNQRFWVWDKSIPTLLTDLHRHEHFRHTLNFVDTPASVRAWTKTGKSRSSKTTPTPAQLSTLGRQRDPHRLKQHIEPHIEKQRPDGILWT
jgi:hypothetical protein